MEDNIEMQRQVGLLYRAAAKPLYNLALYTIGDPASAQQVTIDVFVGAFTRITDKTNVGLFMNNSIRLLYRYILQTCKSKSQIAFQKTTEGISCLNDERKQKFIDILGRLEPDERYILLLFCYQRFSVKCIAQITGSPIFITKKRLHVALNKITAET